MKIGIAFGRAARSNIRHRSESDMCNENSQSCTSKIHVCPNKKDLTYTIIN